MSPKPKFDDSQPALEKICERGYELAKGELSVYLMKLEKKGYKRIEIAAALMMSAFSAIRGRDRQPQNLQHALRIYRRLGAIALKTVELHKPPTRN